MGMVKGFADLPLHGGRVPPWLASRMTRLARIVLKLLVEEYGTTGLLERLADPIWFQALNNLIGMDWDSSGSTTVTTGILKQVLAKEDLGVKAAGGKGERSKKTPEELRVICEKFSLDAEKYVTISRLVAKVDNVALQCGYTLYHHMFFVDRDGNWTIVQQGMNVEEKLARRYHWFSGELEDFVRDPHKAISGVKHEYALNTIARRVDDFRKTVVDLVKEKPETLERDLKTILALAQGNSLLTYYKPYDVKEVLTKVKMYRRLGGLKINRKVVLEARELSVRDFKELLLLKGLGPSTLRALALVAELVYEVPPSWKDPVSHPIDPFKYAYAVGGKDGVPFPVDKDTYDQLIVFLEVLMERVKRHRVLLKNVAKLVRNWKPPPREKKPTL